MEAIRFVVPAVPVAQPRPTATTAWGTAAGSARLIEAKTGHKIYTFKAAVALAASEAYEGPPLAVPLMVSILFVMPRPLSMRRKTLAMPREWSAKKPDIDNLAKAVLDSLNGLTFVDDSLIVDLRVSKVIADGAEQPRVEVLIASAGADVPMGAHQ